MKNNTRKTLSIYLKSAKKYKFSAISSHLAMISTTIIGLISPLYLRNLLDLISSGGDKSAILSQAFGIVKIIFLLEIGNLILWRVVDFCINNFQTRVIADLSNKCFAYLHRHSYSYFNNNFGGSLVKRVKWFTGAFENVSDRIIYNFLPLIVAIIFIIVTLVRFNFWLGFGIFIWVVIFLAVNFAFTRYKLKYDIQRSETETKSTGLLADTIVNHNNVKLFNGYRSEIRRFAEVTEELRKIRLFSWNLGSLFFAVTFMFWIALEIGLYYYSIDLWSKGILTAGWFVLIQLYILNIFDRIFDFGKNIQKLYESLSDAEEMTIILNTPHEIQDALNAENLVVEKGEIIFENVDFNYHSTRSVLKDFNLKIAPKESVALIGASGAGKTTIVKLLLRMHDVTGGHIFIDGKDISKVTQESLWKNVSLVPQDPILFHRSLMENIRYGRLDATDEEVIRVSKLARCHDFIKDTLQGYDTFVGERGIKLSGGERQRIAIARAILKNAPILVLDEATSSLDSNSEYLIQEALDELMKNKTVIVVAHRLSTIRKMDRIIVLDNGKIIETGKHNDLADKIKGAYSKLWQLQAGGFAEK